MIKNSKSYEEMKEMVTKDILDIYNDCRDKDLITKTVDNVPDYVSKFLSNSYYDEVKLFVVRHKYLVGLLFTSTSLEGVITKKTGIVNYSDRLVLRIYNYDASSFLVGNPFDSMDIPDIIKYLETDTIKKSDSIKFRYDIYRDGTKVHSLYGTNNSVVTDYFKSCNGKLISKTKVDTNSTLYTLNYNGETFTFIIKRVLLK